MNSFRNETAFTNDFGKEEALKCAKAFIKRKNHESKRLVIFGFALQKRYPMKMRTSDPEKIRFYI